MILRKLANEIGQIFLDGGDLYMRIFDDDQSASGMKCVCLTDGPAVRFGGGDSEVSSITWLESRSWGIVGHCLISSN